MLHTVACTTHSVKSLLHGPDGIANTERVIGSRFADQAPGANTLNGAGGNDKVNSVDGTKGNDSIDGGIGTDTCTADASDTKQHCP